MRYELVPNLDYVRRRIDVGQISMIRRLFSIILCATLLVSLVSAASAQDSAQLTFLWAGDGAGVEVMRDLLDRFEAANPDIEVHLDAQAESSAREQIEAGSAPDIARLTTFADLNDSFLDMRPFLQDPSLIESHFNPLVINAFRSDRDDEGLYGFPDAAAVVAPYVNRTLFEQAGVALPSDALDEPTWDDWLAALEKVAEATGTPYLLSVDNKDHRLVAPAMSLGAVYFDDEGNLNLPDDQGLRTFLQMLKSLMNSGKTPADTLLGTGKSQDYFVRGESLMYICGSWKVDSVASEVGDAFDWAIVPNPHGEGGSTGVAGFSALVALAQTDHPAAVARVIEFLLQPEIYVEYSARSLTVPAHEALAAEGVPYETDDESVSAALNGFAREAPNLQDQAIMLGLHPLASDYYEASNTYLRQYFAGELTLDEALEKLHESLINAAGA